MRVPTCVSCQLPVLQLFGQFEKLDSYYLDEGGPPSDTAGYWHTVCLTQSPYGPAWYEVRLRNHVDVRRFQRLADVGVWTVVRDPRTGESLAFSRVGEFLHLESARGKPRKVEDGLVFRIERDYNLDFDDRTLIKSIQDGLTTTGTYPIPAILEGMGIAARVHHPVALERAVFRFDRGLRRHWQATFVSAKAEYGRFVPRDLEPYFARGA